MQAPTYQQQERKIHEAYLRNEIEPYNPEFCFCGTLSPDGKGWYYPKPKTHFYLISEYREMEYALLSGISDFFLSYHVLPSRARDIALSPLYEDALFKGMVDALEVLKQIHESKGEVIDIAPVFVKRQLVTNEKNSL